jgi:single-strand DNA-binding protein
VVRRTALANVVKQYVKKGMSVYIEGKIRTRSYEKEGEKRYVTEILVDELTILTPRGSQEGAPAPQNQAGAPPVSQMGPPDHMEDDLPF